MLFKIIYPRETIQYYLFFLSSTILMNWENSVAWKKNDLSKCRNLVVFETNCNTFFFFLIVKSYYRMDSFGTWEGPGTTTSVRPLSFYPALVKRIKFVPTTQWLLKVLSINKPNNKKSKRGPVSEVMSILPPFRLFPPSLDFSRLITLSCRVLSGVARIFF